MRAQYKDLEYIELWQSNVCKVSIGKAQDLGMFMKGLIDESLFT